MKKWFLLPALLLLLALPVSAASVEAVWGDAGAFSSLFNQIDLDEEAPLVSLAVRETVSDVSVAEVVWENDRPRAALLYTADLLVPGEAIHIRGWLGEAFPRFRIRWTDRTGGVVTRYLFESGEDGSLHLSEALDLEEFLTWPGLEETEMQSRDLLARLQEEGLPYEEYDAAASQLYNLWEDQRWALWGGYGVSIQEQHWADQCMAQMLAAGEMYRGTRLYTTLVSALGAEMIRDHIYALVSRQAPNLARAAG